ncbi:YkvA family protein [Treponema sp.]|uniref:YkvA family protein n=1 Tax=Treponema sp. TaxID=166 RepID=UPI003FA2B50D
MYDETKKVSEEELVDSYQKHFDKSAAYKLLKKLRKATRDKHDLIAAPVGVIVNSLGSLLSALDNPATPLHFKALIIGAIGYIIFPMDLVPDMTPVIGYADDVASVAGVVIAVAAYSNFSLADLDAQIDAEA